MWRYNNDNPFLYPLCLMFSASAWHSNLIRLLVHSFVCSLCQLSLFLSALYCSASLLNVQWITPAKLYFSSSPSHLSRTFNYILQMFLASSLCFIMVLPFSFISIYQCSLKKYFEICYYNRRTWLGYLFVIFTVWCSEANFWKENCGYILLMIGGTSAHVQQ